MNKSHVPAAVYNLEKALRSRIFIFDTFWLNLWANKLPFMQLARLEVIDPHLSYNLIRNLKIVRDNQSWKLYNKGHKYQVNINNFSKNKIRHCYCLKSDSHLPEKLFLFPLRKTFEKDEKFLLFRVERSFRSKNIQTFVLIFWSQTKIV